MFVSLSFDFFPQERSKDFPILSFNLKYSLLENM